jgi:hypothetical protein
MVYNDEEEDSQWGQSSSSRTPALTTADDARKQFENALKGGGLQSIAVQKDGTILGFKVPKELLPAVETVLPNAITWLQRTGSQFSYDKALQLTKSRRAATVAEQGIRWGLIGIKPITDAIQNTRMYARQRKALFKEFAPVIEATGVNYQSNEVIRNAFDELHGDMVANMKLLSADLLTLAPMIYVGVQDQRAAKSKRGKEPDSVSESVKTKIDTFKKASQQQIEYERALAAEKRNFIAQEKGKLTGLDGQHLNEKELGEWFDRTVNSHESEISRHRRDHRDRDDHEGNKKSDFSGEQLSILGLSLGSQIIKTNIRDSTARRSKNVNAWKMIKHLREEVEAQAPQGQGEDGYDSGARNADNMYISTKNGRLKLKEYIIEIFQQHERDRLPANSKEGAEERQKLNPLGPALIERLIPTVDIIAEYIAEGRLDTYALVNLVGENKVVIHKQNGARSFAREDEVQKTIDNLLAVMGTHEAIKPEEFFANFADPALIQRTLKNNLQTMQGKEKAFFIALFPDAILEKAGMQKKEIIAQRKEAHRIFYDIAAASTVNIAKKDIATLKKLGLSEKEIAHVQALAEKVEAGDEKAIKSAVDGRDKTLISAIRTVGLNEQVTKTGDGSGFWAKMIEKARSLPELLAERKKTAEEPLSDVSVNHPDVDQETRELASARSDKPKRFSEGFEAEALLSARDREARRRDTGRTVDSVPGNL